MPVVIPEVEVDRLVDKIIASFDQQFKRRINKNELIFSFIQARVDTFVGIQLKTLINNKFFKIRLYIQSFEYKEVIRPYRLEQIIDQEPGPQDEVWVAYAILPRVLFPTMSRVKNQIPEIDNPPVEIPFDKQTLITGPDVNDAGVLSYVTSQGYPHYVSDPLDNIPVIDSVGSLKFLTSMLYPFRDKEEFNFVYYVGEMYKIPAIIAIEEITINADITAFKLGVVENPIEEGYLYKSEDAQQSEKLEIHADITTFRMGVVEDPIVNGYIYKTESALRQDRLTISANITLFTLFQSYFPPEIINVYYKNSEQTNSNYHDDLTISANITSFTLSVTRP